jgi:hypothetical protein
MTIEEFLKNTDHKFYGSGKRWWVFFLDKKRFVSHKDVSKISQALVSLVGLKKRTTW